MAGCRNTLPVSLVGGDTDGRTQDFVDPGQVIRRDVSRDEDGFRTLPFTSAPLGESVLFSLSLSRSLPLSLPRAAFFILPSI